MNDTPRTDSFIAMCKAKGMNLEHGLQDHAEALEQDAAKRIAALLAENERLREALTGAKGQFQEGLSLLTNGTAYDRLHLEGTLKQGWETVSDALIQPPENT